MARCCSAAAETALHSGLAENDDSHWSLGIKGEMKRGKMNDPYSELVLLDQDLIY